MVDEINDPPAAVPDDCEGPSLDTLGNAIRALAAACRLVKAGKIPPERAGTYINGLTSLVKAYQDARDSKWLPRMKEMWREREAQKQQPTQVDH